MSVAQLRGRYPHVDRVYHFTERANVPSIKTHGLLSLHEIRSRGLDDKVRFCSSTTSREIDERHGLDRYVRLCFISNHPMVYRAQERLPVSDMVYVPVAASVLDNPGVRFASGVAFQEGVPIYTFTEALEKLDLDVLFTWQDWHDPAINHRRQVARKYEILVPKMVDPGLILWP